MICMINKGVPIAIFNARGVKSKLQMIHKMARQFAILGVSETCMKTKDDELRQALDASTNAPEVANLNKGYGGVGIIVNPLIPVQVVDKYSKATVQAVSARVWSVTITTIYISPRATAELEGIALQRIHKISGNRAVIMGDMNARLDKWDSKSNTRGRRLNRWARGHGWVIKGPSRPSCITRKGSSSPDIFLIKEISSSDAITRENMTNTSSDHFPVQIWASLRHAVEEQRHRTVPRKQRANPILLREAEIQYRALLSKHIEDTREVRNTTELENAYKKFKELILNPWQRTRKQPPKQYKPFWNNSLDELAKHRP